MDRLLSRLALLLAVAVFGTAVSAFFAWVAIRVRVSMSSDPDNTVLNILLLVLIFVFAVAFFATLYKRHVAIINAKVPVFFSGLRSLAVHALILALIPMATIVCDLYWPVVGAFWGFIAAIGVVSWWEHVYPNIPLNRSRRGGSLGTYKQARRRADRLRKRDDQGICWGGVSLPSHLSKGHFLTVGTTRSGKTVTIRLLLQSIFGFVENNPQLRTIIYDPKREFYPVLRGLGLAAENIKVLNPLDRRSVAWRVSADVASPTSADAFAGILIPETQDQNRYFYDAARQLTRAVLDALILTEKPWTLRHLVAITLDDKALKRVLMHHETTRGVYERYCTHTRSFADVRSTIDTCLAGFRIVAALWEHAPESISLRDWLQQKYVLLMSIDRALERTMLPIYRVIFEFASQLLLNESPDTDDSRRTWVLVDEAREAGRINGLRALLNQGAGNGVRVVLGFQDFDGFVEVYGQHGAAEVTGLCSNKAILRLESPSTAEWASRVIGEAEVREYTVGFSQSSQGQTHSVSEQIRDRRLALPGELMTLPMPDHCVHGYFVTPSVGTYKASVPFKERLTELKDTHFEPRVDIAEQYLRPISSDELDAFGFRPLGDDDATEPPSAPLFDGLPPTILDDMPRLDIHPEGPPPRPMT